MNPAVTVTIDGLSYNYDGPDYTREVTRTEGESGPKAAPYSLEIMVGTKVFIRTVTMYYTGEILAVTPDMVVLRAAAWIPNTGGFNNALRTGELVEVEPFEEPVWVARGAIVDLTPWLHALPGEQK